MNKHKKIFFIFLICLNIPFLYYGILSMWFQSCNGITYFSNLLNIATTYFFYIILLKGQNKQRLFAFMIPVAYFIYGCIYLAFDNAFTPLSYLLSSEMYGVFYTVNSYFKLDEKIVIHNEIGIGLILQSIVFAFLLAKNKPSRADLG